MCWSNEKKNLFAETASNDPIEKLEVGTTKRLLLFLKFDVVLEKTVTNN